MNRNQVLNIWRSTKCTRLYKEFFRDGSALQIWVTSKPTSGNRRYRRWDLAPATTHPFHVSFKGREDLGLMDALLAELPGILNWRSKDACYGKPKASARQRA